MVTDTQAAPVQANTTLRWASFMVNLSWWLGWFAVVLLLAIVIAMTVFDFNVRYASLPIEVTLDELSPGEVISPIHNRGSLPITGFRELKIFAGEMPWLEYMMVAPLVLLGGFLWVVWLLRRFIGNVRAGAPFAPENPKLIESIGWLVVVAGPVYGMLRFIYGLVYVAMVDIPDATLQVEHDFHGLTIVAGLVILVLAQVYRSAVQIKTEADLTI